MADGVILALAIVDGDGDESRAVGPCYWKEAQSAGGVGAGVSDGWMGDHVGVARNSADGQDLIFIGGAAADSGEVDGLDSGAFVDQQIIDSIKSGRIVGWCDNQAEAGVGDAAVGVGHCNGDGGAAALIGSGCDDQSAIGAAAAQGESADKSRIGGAGA